MIWEREDGIYYASVTAPSGEVRFRLTVESFGDRWDWSVWRPGDDPARASHGVAGTVQDAMREAELAALS